MSNVWTDLAIPYKSSDCYPIWIWPEVDRTDVNKIWRRINFKSVKECVTTFTPFTQHNLKKTNSWKLFKQNEITKFKS